MSPLDETDFAHLMHAMDLAERGRAGARPNPVVGAVLAAGDDVISTGYHARYGERHAERIALDAVADVPDDATLYISLEPCAHQGKQPPCAAELVARGVRRVVIGAHDPNPETAGIGPRVLEEAGIEVVWGSELEGRAHRQNRGFRSRFLRGRPWVKYKWAQTVDGKLATGDPSQRWITGEAARLSVHLMRAGSDAVAVGVGTAIEDDCHLTVRGSAATGMFHQPMRVIFDRSLRLPLDRHVVQTASEVPTLVLARDGVPESARRALEAYGVEVWTGPAGEREYLEAALEYLAARNVNDLFVESGPTLALALHEFGLIDETHCYVSPHPSTGHDHLPAFPAEHPLVETTLSDAPTRVGDDLHYGATLSNIP